jgi:ribosomal protein S18 acetylase RimI-like enzyme
MADTLFRPMHDDEQGAVVALWEHTGLARPWNPPEDDIADIRRTESAEILVAAPNGHVVAAVVVCHDGHRGWVYYLGVEPGSRRAGLGRKAMQAAEDWVRDRGIKKLQLMVRKSNGPVIGFYEALGYEEGGVVLMQKWLDPERERLYREAADAH